jgi:hypothetical protein
MWTLRCRAIARHEASFPAVTPLLSRRFEPAVVTTPFTSMLSFTASFNWLVFVGGQ